SSGNYSRPIAAVKSVFNRTSRMRRSWLKPIVRACRRGQFLVKLKTQQKTPLKAAAQLLDLTREFWGDRWDSNPRQPESQSCLKANVYAPFRRNLVIWAEKHA